MAERTCETCRFWFPLVVGDPEPAIGYCSCPKQAQVYTAHDTTCPHHQPREKEPDQ